MERADQEGEYSFIMKTVILCGGRGTRLREVTEEIPKPLIEIGGKPMLWHIMKIYAYHGFKDFILCLGYKGQMIEEYFENNTKEDWSIIYADTGLKTNTGGRIKLIEKHITDETFFTTYGDGLSDLNFHELLAHHKKKGKLATLTCVNPLLQFGVIDIDDDDIIHTFKEKPALNKWINGGFFVFNKAIFEILKEEDVLEKRPFELLAEKHEISAYRYKGFWDCMDTFKDMQLLNNLWKEEKAPWRLWKD